MPFLVMELVEGKTLREFAASRRQETREWLRLALPIWLEVPFFLNAMVFYELADRIFDIRQVKRLFGSIISIGFLAGIIAGLTAAGTMAATPMYTHGSMVAS